MRSTLRSATTLDVTIAADPVVANEADASGSWDAIRADSSIQYAPVDIDQTPREPSWIDDFFVWLAELFEPLAGAFGSSWPVFKWVLIAAAVVFALILLWKLLAPVLDLKRSSSAEEPEDWVPKESQAVALLEEADTLASEGRYDEATHLLLQRSVNHIASARPEWVEPSSTARELAKLPALPEAAKTAFSTIAERVEASLFALKRLSAEDWEAARSAYAEFALQRLVEKR